MSKKSDDEKDYKLYAFKVWSPYKELINEKAAASKMKPNEFARRATLQAADSEILDLPERMMEVRDAVGVLTEQFIRLRSEFAKEKAGGE